MADDLKFSGLVYSSDKGRVCPECQQPVAGCTCKKIMAGPVGNGNVRVGREVKGRKGKGVTVISGLPLTSAQLEELAKELKKQLGTGGTVANGVIEIQGDWRDQLLAMLIKKGYNAKRSGG